MYGVLLISLRLHRVLKLPCFQSTGAEITLTTSGNQTLRVHLSPFFCTMTSEDLNFCEYPYSSNPCQYFKKSPFFCFFFSILQLSDNCGASLCWSEQNILFQKENNFHKYSTSAVIVSHLYLPLSIVRQATVFFVITTCMN